MCFESTIQDSFVGMSERIPEGRRIEQVAQNIRGELGRAVDAEDVRQVLMRVGIIDAPRRPKPR